MRDLEIKNQTLLMDIKFMKDENEKAKQKVKTLETQSMHYEQNLHLADMKLQESLFSLDDLKR